MDEIIDHFQHSQGRIPLDVRLMTEFPGYVRSVYIASGSFIVVEFERYGLDEGGAYFFGHYPDYPSLVAPLETYLSRPIAKWTPLTQHDYPAKPPAATDVRHGTTRLGAAIGSGTVQLPDGARYELRGNIYWARYLKDHYQRAGQESEADKRDNDNDDNNVIT